MEDSCSVNSPRRILSFSKNRRATVFFPDSDEKASSFGVSGERGPKTSEVYGFVGSITTVVATVVFLIWAYFPEHWLHSVGIYYYPSRILNFGILKIDCCSDKSLRYWALAVPTYALVTVVLAIGFYVGLNFMATPPPTSFNTMFDEYSREPVRLAPSMEDDEPPIQPMSDISINQINEIMFNNLS